MPFNLKTRHYSESENVDCNESDIRFTPPSSWSCTSCTSTFSFHRTSSLTKESKMLSWSSPNVTLIRRSQTKCTSLHPKNDIHRRPSGFFHRTIKSIVPQLHSTTMSRLRLLQLIRCPQWSSSFLRRAGRGIVGAWCLRNLDLCWCCVQVLCLPSPASGNGGEDEHNDTLHMHWSADALPSSSIPALELPENPKTWSPTHQSAYLSSTLCGAGAREVPDQLTRHITAFVKEKQITGKTVTLIALPHYDFPLKGRYDKYS